MKMQIGAQLYTVRDFCRDLDGFESTLAQLSSMGFRSVQVSGTCAYQPEWLAEKLDKYSLICPLTHFNTDRILSETDAVIDAHRKFGCKNIGIGGMPDEFRGASDGAKRFSDKFMPAAKRMNERGGKLMYHNHAFEFQKFDGKTVLEKISELFPNDLLNFTLDTYWVQAGGGDAVEWLKKLSGRTECIHLKDMAYDGKSAVYAPVYEGNMNYDAIISTADSLGVKHAFIEQDECYGVDPFKCLEKSLNNIMKTNIR